MGLRKAIQRIPWLTAPARQVLGVLRRAGAAITGKSTSVSAKYRKLGGDDIALEATRLRSSWRDEALPARQRALVDRQLDAYRGGDAVDVFDVYVDALRDIESRIPDASLLEIGCSSGYYSEVMAIAGSRVAYTGCDYSEALIRLARVRHPGIRFDIEDATQLSYPDKSFDIVVSGCCLLHIPEYQTAIAETARVARSSVIFHRTPVLENGPTEFFRKEAYGVETFEIHFSEQELLKLFLQNGLIVERRIDLTREALPSGVVTAVRTYVCRMNGIA